MKKERDEIKKDILKIFELIEKEVRLFNRSKYPQNLFII